MNAGQLVQTIQELEFANLFFFVHFRPRIGIGKRFNGVDFDLHAAVLRTQIISGDLSKSTPA